MKVAEKNATAVANKINELIIAEGKVGLTVGEAAAALATMTSLMLQQLVDPANPNASVDNLCTQADALARIVIACLPDDETPTMSELN